jgi:hypothetical protein
MLAGDLKNCAEFESYEVRNELTVGLSRRSEDLLPGRLRFAVRDILPNGSTEQHGLLSDVSNASPQLLGVHRADVLAIDQDSARGWIVESHEQACNCTLSST